MLLVGCTVTEIRTAMSQRMKGFGIIWLDKVDQLVLATFTHE